jgi:hypothetical protein
MGVLKRYGRVDRSRQAPCRLNFGRLGYDRCSNA